MATLQDRLGTTLNRLATLTNAARSQVADDARAAHNDSGREARLEQAVEQAERAADELEEALVT